VAFLEARLSSFIDAAPLTKGSAPDVDLLSALSSYLGGGEEPRAAVSERLEGSELVGEGGDGSRAYVSLVTKSPNNDG
jgi:hypothetical protein